MTLKDFLKFIQIEKLIFLFSFWSLMNSCAPKITCVFCNNFRNILSLEWKKKKKVGTWSQWRQDLWHLRNQKNETRVKLVLVSNQSQFPGISRAWNKNYTLTIDTANYAPVLLWKQWREHAHNRETSSSCGVRFRVWMISSIKFDLVLPGFHPVIDQSPMLSAVFGILSEAVPTKVAVLCCFIHFFLALPASTINVREK